MDWTFGLRRKDPASQAQGGKQDLSKSAITRKEDAVLAKLREKFPNNPGTKFERLDSDAFDIIKLVPGTVAGEGEYLLITDNSFSRSNFTRSVAEGGLGLQEGVDFTKKGHPEYNGYLVIFTLKEKALETALGIEGPDRPKS